LVSATEETVYRKPRLARPLEAVKGVVAVPPAAGALNRFKLNERTLSG
jgi:hypothetical protein